VAISALGLGQVSMSVPPYAKRGAALHHRMLGRHLQALGQLLRVLIERPGVLLARGVHRAPAPVSVRAMSEDEIDFRPDVDETDLDRAVSASTLALSAIPTIGPLIAEAVKHSIPNQRIDRIARMLKFLDCQVADMQEGLREQRMRTDEFRDLLEDALWQTTRTLTDERRAYIASLLKNSIKSDDLAHEQEKELLSLLGQLNDSELIILGWYGTEYVGEKADEYFRRHEEVLYSPLIETNATDEELRDATLKEAHHAKLRRLGLARPGKGKLDQITELGRLLLRQIDFYSLEPSE
jgi:hypothetical protein